MASYFIAQVKNRPRLARIFVFWGNFCLPCVSPADFVSGTKNNVPVLFFFTVFARKN
jgi:hypothetical protein